MTGGADLRVDLQAASERGAVEGAEDAVERPRLGGRFRDLGESRAGAEGQRQGGAKNECAHQAASVTVSVSLVTAALMLSGGDRGRSSLPSTGITTSR